MSKIKFSNDSVYSISDYAAPNRFVVLLDNLTATDVLENLTEENLSEIQFMTDDGAVTGVYHSKLLCGYEEYENMLKVRINDADLCRYGLMLDEDNRIVSAIEQRYAPDNAVIVNALPDGDIHDYLYVDGEYIYSPLPIPEPEEPQPTQEDRIAALEEQNAFLTECLLEMSETLYA